ncbi:hypothetical protein [Eisenbergiella porci]|uniref:hypothetical protein n=1 Tax=Eisenbergiella porci TaxID=2652274 RepID=UPI002A80AB4C|nr:hypothetical protein [Eisenbergiella porci]
MQKICILTWHDISSAYACLHYLKDELLQEVVAVDIWGFSHSSQIIDNNGYYHSFTDSWYGKIRRFRVYMSKLHALLISFNYDVIILNDLSFYRCGYIINKLFPNKKIIHYNTEIHGSDVTFPHHTVSFYKKHANYPDMIIECLKERADYRKKEFGIRQKIYVIDNTLPKSEVQKALAADVDVSKYLQFKNNKLPTLIYAGGCNLSRNLGDILKCATDFSGKLNFLFFCYGSSIDFQRVQSVVDINDNCYLYKAVDRVTLLNVMAKCDIGIQYYDPTFGINHYLASPSKFYEYISVGLNVVSSNNHGIDRMINDHDLGVCFTNEEGIKGGIKKLLAKGLNSRENIKRTFEKYFCYEVDSKEALDAMRKLIDIQ